jgi:hypothetical protein
MRERRHFTNRPCELRGHAKIPEVTIIPSHKTQDDRIQKKEKHPLYDRLCREQCYWCVFTGEEEPTNQEEKGWQILGWQVQSGIFFAFETKDGEIHPIHITCWGSLADTDSRLQMLERSNRWWFMTPTKYVEYPSPEIFKKHFPNAFSKKKDVKV